MYKLPDFLYSKEFLAFCKTANIDQNQLIIRSQNINSQIQYLELLQEIQSIITDSQVSTTTFEKNLQLARIDPKILQTFEKLGVPIAEKEMLLAKQGLIAMDYVLDSTSVFTSFQSELEKLGIIFCSMSEAIAKHGDLVQKYLGTVVPYNDNFYASLNSAVFSDGSFCYIPPNVDCPMELSTYFRINTAGTGQFERTLIIADVGSSVSYLEGCTAPQFSSHQLHCAVVELIAMDNATIKYSTVQNWYPGDKNGKGGVYNFVTKRGLCKGKNSKISWTQIETGSSITWKYPSVILKGENSVGEFYSVAVVDDFMQADTGTRMIHLGKNTRSKIISKSISKKNGTNTYRGKVNITQNATDSRNYTRCDSLFIEPEVFINQDEIDILKQVMTKI
jgi:Fe-S cluster assembly protein SufB